MKKADPPPIGPSREAKQEAGGDGPWCESGFAGGLPLFSGRHSHPRHDCPQEERRRAGGNVTTSSKISVNFPPTGRQKQSLAQPGESVLTLPAKAGSFLPFPTPGNVRAFGARR